MGLLPFAGLLGLAMVLLAIPTYKGVRRHMNDIEKLLPFMGSNVVLNILTPLLVALGIFISA